MLLFMEHILGPGLNPTFDKLYRQLGLATFWALVAGLTLFGLALLCALLGLPHAVASLTSVAASVAVVFAALLGVFLVGSVVAAVIRWIDRRYQIKL